MEDRMDVMTDYQMRTLMNMIIEIVMKGKNKKETVARLLAIRDGEPDFKDSDFNDYEKN